MHTRTRAHMHTCTRVHTHARAGDFKLVVYDGDPTRKRKLCSVWLNTLCVLGSGVQGTGSAPGSGVQGAGSAGVQGAGSAPGSGVQGAGSAPTSADGDGTGVQGAAEPPPAAVVHLRISKGEIDGAASDRKAKLFPAGFELDVGLARSLPAALAEERGRDDAGRATAERV